MKILKYTASFSSLGMSNESSSNSPEPVKRSSHCLLSNVLSEFMTFSYPEKKLITPEELQTFRVYISGQIRTCQALFCVNDLRGSVTFDCVNRFKLFAYHAFREKYLFEFRQTLTAFDTFTQISTCKMQ